jgi:hypothetical protein
VELCAGEVGGNAALMEALGVRQVTGVVVPLLALAAGLGLYFYWRRGGNFNFKGILLSSEVKPPKDSKGGRGGEGEGGMGPLEEGGSSGKVLKFSENPMGVKAGRTPMNPLLESRGSSKLATSPIVLDIDVGANRGSEEGGNGTHNPLVRASLSMGSNNPSISAPMAAAAAAQAITEPGPVTPIEPPPPTPTTPVEPPA